MAKLVILSQGMTGRSHELKVDKTTIGRVEDNTFQIAEPSVSSHHCEMLLRGRGGGRPGSQFHQRHLHQRRKNHRSRFEARPDPAPGPDRVAAGDGAPQPAPPRAAAAPPAKKTPDSTRGHATRGEPDRSGSRRAQAGSTRRARDFTKKDNKAQQDFPDRRHRGRRDHRRPAGLLP